MKILVTGGSGFIGTNLCKYIIEKGHSVICVDNFYTSSKKNILGLINNKNFLFLKKDIERKIEIDCDGIINLACPASPIHYQKDPIKTFKTSVIGTINLLELAKKKQVRFLLASTSEIYGNPLIHPQSENYFGNVNLNGPRSCYDEGKRASETVTNDYRKFYNIDTRIIRIFNTYGPYMAENDGRVVSNFIIKCLKNEDIEIYGDGNKTRSFSYIDDTVKGIYKVFMNKERIENPLNIGSIKEVKVIKLAKLIKKLTKSESKIIFKSSLQDDPYKRKPDLKNIKKLLRWSPKVSLEDGLLKTIKYFEKSKFI